MIQFQETFEFRITKKIHNKCVYVYLKYSGVVVTYSLQQKHRQARMQQYEYQQTKK